MARLLLAGYFGSGNLGDDAIMLGFLKGIEGLGHEVRVICGNVERLMRQYGVKGVAKSDLGSVKSAIKECDVLVFPGGSIFQDVTSVRSVAYYSNLVKEAKKAGKKVALLGQGIGPLDRYFGKKMAAAAFDSADVIALRDTASVSTLKSLGCRVTPRVTGDCAFLLPKPEISNLSTSFGVAGMKTIGISARPWGNDKNKTVVKVFGELIKTLSANGYVPVMIPMDASEDLKIVESIAKTFGGKVPDLKGLPSPVVLQERLIRMEAVIGMRLHAGILAATVNVPAFMISYDPKVTAFANVLGFSTPLPMQGISSDRIFSGFQTFIKDRERMVASLEKRQEEFVRAATGNIDALRALLGE
ncbi:polysaccharide pyruvyl transferase CsaB [Kamptonema cortianum]|nr:polysaccharide pyruvyl transferase CsaB [Geitlerinema splendidum]MDK3161046.1 polysaccharide pyruvyl transferase CsaB [Kamptonema cortianum]